MYWLGTKKDCLCMSCMSCSNGTTTVLCSCPLRGNQESLCGQLNVANGKVSNPEVTSNLFNSAQSTVTYDGTCSSHLEMQSLVAFRCSILSTEKNALYGHHVRPTLGP